MQKPASLVRIVPAALAALGLAAGCATHAPGRPAAGGTIQVVAAENFWGSIAAQLGGSHARVTSIIGDPNTDPHSYEPTTADARAVSTARLVLVNQAGYDTWADRLLAADPAPERTEIGVGTLVGVGPGGNPHRWYSPEDVSRVIDAVTAAYQRIDPADRDYFAARKAAFTGTDLAAYHRLIAEIKTRYAGTPIGASESIVAPLAADLGLDLVTPQGFLEAVSEGNEPTPADKALIDAQIRQHRIKVYVYNSQNTTPDVAAQLAEVRAAGIPTVSVTETLSPAGSTFQAWQTSQLQSLQQALAAATGR